jgi:hypothetical protein
MTIQPINLNQHPPSFLSKKRPLAEMETTISELSQSIPEIASRNLSEQPFLHTFTVIPNAELQNESGLESLIAATNQSDQVSSLQEGWDKWCEEAQETNEYASRLVAIQKIRECYVNKTTYLDLARLNLTSLPPFGEGTFPNVTDINFSQNNLAFAEDFKAFPNVKTINLGLNKLIAVSNFSAFQKLETLHLYDNELETVPDFNALLMLLFLNLSRNRLKTVPNFNFLRRLMGLTVGNNQLKKLPDFALLQDLDSLEASCNQIDELPDLNLQRLQTLNVHKNKLTKISDLRTLPKLQILDLSANSLTEVPDFATSLLRELNLSNNEITYVFAFSTALNITDLDLSNNRLSQELGASVFQKLQQLNLRDNLFVNIPNSLAELPCTCKIFLECNPISDENTLHFREINRNMHKQHPSKGPLVILNRGTA